MAFIDRYRTRFGMRADLSGAWASATSECAPSTFYAYRSRPPSARAQRDGWLVEQIRRVHEENYGVYGAVKVWAQLNRQGTRVARCTVERLMRNTDPAWGFPRAAQDPHHLVGHQDRLSG